MLLPVFEAADEVIDQRAEAPISITLFFRRISSIIQMFKYHNVHTLNCDNMKFSINQQRAITEIGRITGHFGKDRWFIQEEVIGAGYKTLMALVNKDYLNKQSFDHVNYYQIKKV
jgi:hypothetical protein